ncbi:MAG: hypothetical protein FWB99_09125, partial [Treponema sp.]|nr:hypothetical protein [Treponema sp.]
ENGEPIESLAKRYDRSKSAIWQRIQLLDLNDGIKEMFKEGILSLHATAMLKSLTAEQQELFYSQFSTLQEIDEYDVQGFLAAIHHDKLYKCIAGKECLTCKKRFNTAENR